MLARQDRGGCGLVEGVGRVDAVPRQMRGAVGARRGRQVHELVAHHTCEAALHVLVEVVGASHAAASLQWRCHVWGTITPRQRAKPMAKKLTEFVAMAGLVFKNWRLL